MRAVYRLDDIGGLHLHEFIIGNTALHVYVWCDASLEGELAHECARGSGAHGIKVCVLPSDNSTPVYQAKDLPHGRSRMNGRAGRYVGAGEPLRALCARLQPITRGHTVTSMWFLLGLGTKTKTVAFERHVRGHRLRRSGGTAGHQSRTPRCQSVSCRSRPETQWAELNGRRGRASRSTEGVGRGYATLSNHREPKARHDRSGAL